MIRLALQHANNVTPQLNGKAKRATTVLYDEAFGPFRLLLKRRVGGWATSKSGSKQPWTELELRLRGQRAPLAVDSITYYNDESSFYVGEARPYGDAMAIEVHDALTLFSHMSEYAWPEFRTLLSDSERVTRDTHGNLILQRESSFLPTLCRSVLDELIQIRQLAERL